MPKEEWRAERERLGKLAQFAHSFTEPGAEFAKLEDDFRHAAYADGWVVSDFDWPSWAKGPQAQDLYWNRSAIAAADAETLRKLLTTLIRQERFCEGGLKDAFDSGVLLAIAQRAGVLARMSKPSAS